MVVELHANNLEASLSFWRGVLGFETAFERSGERSPIWSIQKATKSCCASGMVVSRRAHWTLPLGRGALFQIHFGSIEPVLTALGVRNWPIYLGPREVWRRTGDCESGQREVFVQDPDGYLLMVAENIGRRPLLKPPAPPIKS
jgi:catechol 2,3-dioxygenase-like lactoylglutathione lyase family enzyme